MLGDSHLELFHSLDRTGPVTPCYRPVWDAAWTRADRNQLGVKQFLPSSVASSQPQLLVGPRRLIEFVSLSASAVTGPPPPPALPLSPGAGDPDRDPTAVTMELRSSGEGRRAAWPAGTDRMTSQTVTRLRAKSSLCNIMKSNNRSPLDETLTD